VRYTCGEGRGSSSTYAGRSSATVAGWYVDDLEQTVGELRSRGVEFERYEQPGLKTDEHGVFHGRAFRAAGFRDPDGNTMAITQVR
jgi:hypothetical protein